MHVRLVCSDVQSVADKSWWCEIGGMIIARMLQQDMANEHVISLTMAWGKFVILRFGWVLM